MAALSQDELRELVTQSDDVCISIIMPTHKGGQETRQDPIRFKNLINDAENQLKERGVDDDDLMGELFEPLATLHDDESFWQNRTPGLAIFRSRNVMRTFDLPVEAEEIALVANQFHLRPLMSLLTNNGQFFVLGLDQQEVQLFRCTQYSTEQIDLSPYDIPQTISDALWMDDPEKQSQFYSGAPQGGGPQGGQTGAVFHGTGAAAEGDNKKNIRRFFDSVNNGMHDVVHDERIPMVLAGVEYLLPIYREANSYPHLVEDEFVGKSIQDMSPDEVREAAWPIVEPRFAAVMQQSVDDFMSYTGNQPDRASIDLKEIVSAAFFGRVDTVFVAEGVHQWGVFNQEENKVELHDDQQEDSSELFDLAAIHTFLNSGTVYVVDQDDVPQGGPIAASFRY